MSDPQVIIVGAGQAGLSVSHELVAAVLVVALVLLYPRFGNAAWVWLAIGAVFYATALAIIRARR